MKIVHHFGAGVYIKETHFEAGEWGEKHAHSHDHLSLLASGTVRLKVDGEAQEITGPMVVTVKAGKVHQVLAITNAVWNCIHATDCTDPAQIDNVLKED